MQTALAGSQAQKGSWARTQSAQLWDSEQLATGTLTTPSEEPTITTPCRDTQEGGEGGQGLNTDPHPQLKTIGQERGPWIEREAGSSQAEVS